MTRWDRNAKTPFDRDWPEVLTARVVDPGPPLRIHGYAIDDDLAVRCSTSDVTFLALTGELPDEERSRVFAITMTFLAGITVAEAPTHAAVLARICNGTTSAILGAAAISLAEQARWTVTEYRGEAASNGGDVPPRVSALARATGLEILMCRRTSCSAALAALEWCGLGRDEQLESAFVAARLPVVAAEAFATPPGSFRDYPLNLPPFAYEEPDE
jgi:hypothetical protein